MKRHLCLLLLTTSLACGQTEECKGLEGLLKIHEEALLSAQGQAEAHDKLVPRLAEAREKAEAVLGELGFDLDEKALADKLATRVAAVGDASMTRQVATVQLPSGGSTDSQTFWQVTFAARRPAAAFEKIWALARTPPLFELRRIAAPDRGKVWQADLYRSVVDRVPIKPDAIPLPFPPDAAAIAPEFGFCGAGKMRARIAEIRSEMTTLKEKAEGTTVLLPSISSWLGLEQRARKKLDIENESRRLIGLMLEAAVAARLPIKGAGFDAPMVVLDASGSAKQRKNLESTLAGKIQGVRALESPKGTIRIGATNARVRASGKGPGGAERH